MLNPALDAFNNFDNQIQELSRRTVWRVCMFLINFSNFSSDPMRHFTQLSIVVRHIILAAWSGAMLVCVQLIQWGCQISAFV